MDASDDQSLPALLVALTVVTGLVDAASFLSFGHVFTANMTGNVVFLGFALAGATELSFARSAAALVAFAAGAVLGGRIARRLASNARQRWIGAAFSAEAALLIASSLACCGAGADISGAPVRIYLAIVLTAVAMGIRNAVVRKLAVPDLTTTVLTMTITGIAADSTLARGANPAWKRRLLAVAALLAGAALGAWLLTFAVALPLGASAAISGACAAVTLRRPIRPHPAASG